MKPDWLFSIELPLPTGLEIIPVATASQELGAQRLTSAAEVVGEQGAQDVAETLGRYQLDDELVARLHLDGVKLGAGGEVPALSPEAWLGSDSETLTGLHSGGREIVGVALSREQSLAFLGFLARNRVSADVELAPEKIVAVARHFFFAEPLHVVVRYTGPRFAQA